jgi:tetratricopeptide (TPR) repeat protein
MLAIKKSAAAPPTLFCWLWLAACLVGCRPSGPRLLLDGERLLREGNYPAAVQTLTEATRQLPTTAQAWNHLGLAHHSARQPKPALEAYQRALGVDRNLAAARFNLGCLHLEQNNLPAAIAELTTFTVLSNRSVPGWLKLGTAQLRARQYDAAEKSFATALKLDQRQPEAWNGLGVAQAMRRRPREAMQSFAHALGSQADYAPALLNQAIVAHQALNDRPIALQKYREYVALRPTPVHAAAVAETTRALELELSPPPRSALTNPLALVNSATTHKPAAPTNALAQTPVTNAARPKPPAPAAQLAAETKVDSPVERPKPTPPPTPTPADPPPKVEVVQLNPENPTQPPRDDAPTATPQPVDTPPASDPPKPAPSLAEPTPTEAIPATAPSTQVASGLSKPSFFQKVNPLNLLRSGEKPGAATPPNSTPPKATPLLSPPVPLTAAAAPSQPTAAPSEPWSRAAPGVTPLPGRFAVRRYVYLSPTRPAPGNRRAALTAFDKARQAQQAGRLREAIAAYEEAVRLDASLFEAHYNLGVAAQEAGEFPRALSAYEHALSINPTALNARHNFALALRQAGYPRDAAEELEKLLTSHPEETRAHFTLANLYAQQLYQTQPARAHYQKVLELQPQHPQAAAIRYWLTANP